MKKILLTASVLGALFLFGCGDKNVSNTNNDTNSGSSTAKEFTLQTHVGANYKDENKPEMGLSDDIRALDVNKVGIAKENIKEILDNNDHGKSFMTLKKGSDGLFTPANLTLKEPTDLKEDEVAIPVSITELADSSGVIVNKQQVNNTDEAILLSDEELESVNTVLLAISDFPQPEISKDDIGKDFKVTYIKDGNDIKIKSKEELNSK